MRELALTGLIAIGFGLGSFYATDHLGVFSVVNLTGGSAALLAALAMGARRVRFVGGAHSRPVVLRGLGRIVLALGVAVAAERAAHFSGLRTDWTFEKRYELAPSLVALVKDLPGLEMFLFYDPLDPRIRRSRLLIEEVARHADVRVESYEIDAIPEALEGYGVTGSNNVLLRRGERFQLVSRPTEGAIYEALYRMQSIDAGVVAILRGEGEGDPQLTSEAGYSGLASMLVTEGYEVRSLVTMALRDVPDDVDVLVAIAPERRIEPGPLAAIQRFLRRGGGLVALLEPGAESGLEALLAEWGLQSPDAVLVDPAHGESQGAEAAGLCPLAHVYPTHPVTRGLDRNRMTFFCGARSFVLRKPEVEDELTAVVLSSPRGWLTTDLSVLERRGGNVERHGEREDYQPIAVAARYERDGVETRIFAVGDADFASNRYLRTLYNLDLAMNGVHWTAEREPQITLRPKIRSTVQFPLPVQSSLEMLYGVGLLIPEALLIAGGIVWLRRRSA
jgi:hypothetical protein